MAFFCRAPGPSLVWDHLDLGFPGRLRWPELELQSFERVGHFYFTLTVGEPLGLPAFRGEGVQSDTHSRLVSPFLSPGSSGQESAPDPGTGASMPIRSRRHVCSGVSLMRPHQLLGSRACAKVAQRLGWLAERAACTSPPTAAARAPSTSPPPRGALPVSV